MADSGRGIAPDFLPHVFERFRQGDSSTTRQYGGLGIGLALVKQLVELHGGTVRARRAPAWTRARPSPVSLPVLAAQTERIQPEAPVRPEPVVIPAENLGGLRVLVVDDDKDSLEVVKRILTSRKAEVESCGVHA